MDSGGVFGALAGTVEDIASAVSTVAANAGTAISVAQDPYLPEVICHAQQLAAINAVPPRPIPVCAPTPSGRPGGIGLGKVMTPLRAYVYAEQHPWVYPVAAIAAIGVPVLLGYMLGRMTR